MDIAPGKSLARSPERGIVNKASVMEELMRLSVLACSLGAIALTGLAYSSDPAAAAKTKMGCERGKEVWSAPAGKCVAGKSKYTKVAASKPAKKAAKKAPAAKAAPKADKK